jgi:SAM-dependent methyltransferase
MAMLSPLRSLARQSLYRLFRRSDYRAVWDWHARSQRRARLAVSGSADAREIDDSGEETASHLRSAARIGPDDTVLEIGCGVGRVGKALAPHCRRWIGGDVSSKMIEHAREALAPFRNVDFVQLDGFSLAGIPAESIDVVYSTTVFMHLEEWDRYGYVEEAFRVLRDTGRVYVDNINLLGEEGWQLFLDMKRLPPGARPPHISKTSTPEELRTYLQRAGFTGIVVSPGPLWLSAMGVKPERR